MRQKQYDSIFDKVVEEIIQCDSVSIPFLQRRFLIGYSRALRLISKLEKFGYIEKGEEGKPRKVLHNKLLQ